MSREDLYGAVGLTLQQVAEAVTSALGTSFELHDSSFYGGDYYTSGGDDDLIQVVANFADPYDGELFEPDFPAIPMLVYVGRSSDECARALEVVPGFRLLRTEER